MPPGVKLDSLSLDYGARLALALQLEARATRDYDLFLQRMAAAPALADLQPHSELRDSGVRGGLNAVWSEVKP
jgi:hypothetical protein